MSNPGMDGWRLYTGCYSAYTGSGSSIQQKADHRYDTMIQDSMRPWRSLTDSDVRPHGTTARASDNRQEEASPMDLSPSYWQKTLHSAWELMKQGLKADVPNRSSENALQQTPHVFTDAHPNLKLMPHQLHAIGHYTTLLRDPDKVTGAVCAYEMGLGKTYIMHGILQDFSKSARAAGQPMLVVLPASLVMQWRQELQENAVPALTCFEYRNNVGATVEQMNEYDVVLTTFDMVRDDWKRQHQAHSAMAKDSYDVNGGLRRTHHPLMVMEFFMVIVGELSKALNPSANVFRALCALRSKRRLGCTGTPLSNDYRNVLALLRFVNLTPWCEESLFKSFFWKKSKGSRRAIGLTGMARAMLAVSLRPVVAVLKIDDEFNGKAIVAVQRANWHRIEIPIVDDLRERQKEKREKARGLLDPSKVSAKHILHMNERWDKFEDYEKFMLKLLPKGIPKPLTKSAKSSASKRKAGRKPIVSKRRAVSGQHDSQVSLPMKNDSSRGSDSESHSNEGELDDVTEKNESDEDNCLVGWLSEDDSEFLPEESEDDA